MYMKVTTKKRLFIRGTANDWMPFQHGDRIKVLIEGRSIALIPSPNGLLISREKGKETIKVYLSQNYCPLIISGGYERAEFVPEPRPGGGLSLPMPEHLKQVPPGSIQAKPSKPRGSSQLYKGVNVTPIAIQAEDVALVVSYLKVVNKAITQRKLEVYLKENGTIGARAWRELLP